LEEHYSDIVLESIQRAQTGAIETHSLLFFKANLKQYVQLHSRLDQLEQGPVVYTGLYRQNLFDRCTCMIRDCFLEARPYGIAVFPNGTETTLCFERRQHPEVHVQALFTDVKGCLREAEERVNSIQTLTDYNAFSSEELFQFEESMEEQDWTLSIHAWMYFLRPLLHTSLEWDLVAEALEEGRGTRMDVKSQESKVYNYEEVKEELTP
jgi:hypothetical protein